MNDTIINYGLSCLLISFLYGLLPLTNAGTNAGKSIIPKSLTQQKNNKAYLTSTPSPESYNKNILHESSKSINLDNDIDEESEEAYRLLNERQQDSLPWNSYNFPMPMLVPYSPFAAISQTPKIFNFLGYPQPFFIPYHVGNNPELLYTPFVENNQPSEDHMSRARRPTSNSPKFPPNSPIYYVRLPPTPYMFLPNFNYPTAKSSSNPYTPPYASLSSFHALPMSSVFNLPMNFLANGKPITSTLMPHIFPERQYHPIGVRPSTPISLPEITETKLTSPKGPYIFNGRPDDIYILPNNFNSIYSEANFY